MDAVRKVLVCSKVVNLGGRIRTICQRERVSLDRFNITSFSPAEEVDQFLAQVPSSQIVLADPPVVAKALKVLSEVKLKDKIWIQSTWAGVDAIAAAFENNKSAENNCVITRMGGALSTPMAEYVLGQIIAQERGFYDMFLAQQKTEWMTKLDDAPYAYRPLKDLTIGVLGYGSIGQEVCRALQSAFYMNTVAWVRTIKPLDDQVPLVTKQLTDIETVLEQSDYVVNCLPSTKETKGLLNGSILERCKKGAVLMNVGRGDVVSEQTVLEALEKKWIKKAVLDVFGKEPLPKESLLWKHPQVVITPHVAAVTLPDDAATVFVENLKIYLEDSSSIEKLKYVVDFKKGY